MQFAAAVALTCRVPVVFTIPDGVVVPPVELFTERTHGEGCTVALAKNAIRVWFEPAVWLVMVIVEVVLVEVTLYIVMFATEVTLRLSNCQ